jgi:hypothetical protein
MNNCILDYDNKIKIPQNKNKFFIIEKNKEWVNSIVVSFDINETVDYVNLFFILKSYALGNHYLVYSIGTSFYDLNSKTIITQKENSRYINRMLFDDFVE